MRLVKKNVSIDSTNIYIFIFQDSFMNRKFKNSIYLFVGVHAKKLDFFNVKTLL